MRDLLSWLLQPFSKELKTTPAQALAAWTVVISAVTWTIVGIRALTVPTVGGWSGLLPASIATYVVAIAYLVSQGLLGEGWARIQRRLWLRPDWGLGFIWSMAGSMIVACATTLLAYQFGGPAGETAGKMFVGLTIAGALINLMMLRAAYAEISITTPRERTDLWRKSLVSTLCLIGFSALSALMVGDELVRAWSL